MTKEIEVIEGNKLIQKFMGGGRRFKDFGIVYPDPTSTSGGYQKLNGLKYHTSWDWLMPVVEKIEALGFQFIINNEGACIKKWFYRGNVPDIAHLAESKVDAVWTVVIQFIQWYNSQQPTTTVNK